MESCDRAKLLDPSLHIPNMKHGDVIEKLTDIVQSARRTYANANVFGSEIIWGLQNAHSSRVADVTQYTVIALKKEAETDPDLRKVVVKTSQQKNPTGLTYEVYDSHLTLAASKANGFQVLNPSGSPVGGRKTHHLVIQVYQDGGTGYEWRNTSSNHYSLSESEFSSARATYLLKARRKILKMLWNKRRRRSLALLLLFWFWEDSSIHI